MSEAEELANLFIGHQSKALAELFDAVYEVAIEIHSLRTALAEAEALISKWEDFYQRGVLDIPHDEWAATHESRRAFLAKRKPACAAIRRGEEA
jgi:hypothetical protein